MKEKITSFFNLAKQFIYGIFDEKLTTFASSGCYYLFITLVPIVMIFCCILPYTPFQQEMVLEYVDLYFAESLGEIVRNITNAIYRSNAATLTVSIFLTLYTASASMKAIMKGINAAYKSKIHDNIIVFTLKALIYMVLLLITMLLALVVMVFGGKILELIQLYLPYLNYFDTILSKTRYLLVMVILFVIFTALYKMIPSKKLKYKEQIPGAIFASVIWVVFSWIFTLYVNISDQYGAYGVIGTVMVSMLWGFYCLMFLLIGGFLNNFIAERKELALIEAQSADFSDKSSDSLAELKIETRSINEEKNTSAAPIVAAVGGVLAALFAIIFFSIKNRKLKKSLAAALAPKPGFKEKMLSALKEKVFNKK